MATKPTTTPVAEPTKTVQLQQENNNELIALEKQRVALGEHYKNEKRYAVQGAPMYRDHFGKSMPICINGISISVPLDGQRYEIPESFACIFNERITKVNEQLEMQKKMSNITQNRESFAGELDLIRPV